MVNYEESNAGFHNKGGYYQHGRGRLDQRLMVLEE